MPTGQVDVIGHSLGGLVVCIVAVERAERVRRLILECSCRTHVLRPRRLDPTVTWRRLEGG